MSFYRPLVPNLVFSPSNTYAKWVIFLIFPFMVYLIRSTPLSGQLMVCIAAREFSVPVVCVAGAFTLTPLFAHNQSQVLNQVGA
jgi:hypothetical protein